MRHSLKKAIVSSAICSLIFASLTVPARADEFAEKGRPIFEKNQHGVVTVEVVQKVAAAGRSGTPRESKQDLTGTVIDPSGLVVLALSSIDPSELYRRLSEDYKMDIEVSEIKIMLEDGTELPAEIVLRDKDLDLAFLRPKTKPTSPMPTIDLSAAGTAQVLDQVISLNRLKRAAGRAYCASEERISAVLQKPRTFYIPDSSMSDTSSGSPAFTLDGKLLGIFVMRAVNSAGAGNLRDCYTAIILPAADILKSSAQAPSEVKPDGEKKEAPKADATPKPDAPK